MNPLRFCHCMVVDIITFLRALVAGQKDIQCRFGIECFLRRVVAQLIEHLTRDRRVASLILTAREVTLLCP